MVTCSSRTNKCWRFYCWCVKLRSFTRVTINERVYQSYEFGHSNLSHIQTKSDTYRMDFHAASPNFSSTSSFTHTWICPYWKKMSTLSSCFVSEVIRYHYICAFVYFAPWIAQDIKAEQNKGDDFEFNINLKNLFFLYFH